MKLNELPDNIQLVVTKSDLVELVAELISSSGHSTQVLPEKQYYTHEEAAEYLGIARQTLYALTSNRHIPYQKRGGKANLFLRADLDNWLRQNRKPSQQELAAQAEELLAKSRLNAKGGAKYGK